MSASKLAVYWHPDVLKHDPGRGCYEYEASPLMEVAEPHPETPERIINIRSILQRGDISGQVDWRDGRHAERHEIERFHTAAYVDEVIEAEKHPPTRIDGSGTVRQALKEQASALEEGKADVLGLYMVSELIARNEMEADLDDHFVTFLAGFCF